MDKALYRVVLTGQLVSGFSRQAVLAALARTFESSAATLSRALDAGDCPIDDALPADEAAALQKRLEAVGARARIERFDPQHMAGVGPGLRLPQRDGGHDPGMMSCPACGHRQLVAPRCDACGIVFAEFNRRRRAGGPSVASPPDDPARGGRSARRPVARDIHAVASDGWRHDWLDDEQPVPTEEYHVRLFMGPGSAHLAEACNRLSLGRRTRFKPTWAGGAVFSPFLWAMYRKMWALASVLLVLDVLLPVGLIAAGLQPGLSDKLVYLGVALLVGNRLFWPAFVKSLYCRHARNTVMYLHRLSPTYAPDIDIATRGGTSRSGVLIGSVLALVLSLLVWSTVDQLHGHFIGDQPAFLAAPTPAPATGPVARPGQAATPRPPTSQDAVLAEENRWVATRNRLRVVGQQLNTWFANGGRSADAAGMDMATVSAALGLDAEATRDGWGREVRYASDGKGFRLFSAGPDGEFGTPDDLEYRRLLE
jgi:hypothetical protein